VPDAAKDDPLDASPYDAIPYPGRAFAQTHPDRLATLATLFGVSAPDPAGCRVLELGCGDGANLLPMASGIPSSSFVGLDSAAGAIGLASATAQELGLENVRFEAGSIETYEPPAGGFDYVIAHGVYSWVPAPVRDSLLAVCARALSPSGVAYMSYNALPGGRLRQALRELLTFHLDGVDEPQARIAAARELLELLRDAWETGEDGHPASTLGALAEPLLRRPPAALFHDELAPVNDPFYFHEFLAHAGAHGLQFLAEAEFSEMQAGVMPESIERELLPADEPLRREQYLDFIKGRMFRQTLLCHARLEVDRTPRPERRLGLWVSSPARATASADGQVTFSGPGSASLTTDHGFAARVLEPIGASWPSAVAVAELAPPDAPAAEREVVCASLLRCYAADFVQLHTCRPAACADAGERPRASPLARLQARDGELVTNLRHASVRLEDELARRLVMLLDGTRDRAALIEQLGAAAGVPGEELVAGLERSLAALARLALLSES
jgi:SAM-dependent methyltransferase